MPEIGELWFNPEVGNYYRYNGSEWAEDGSVFSTVAFFRDDTYSSSELSNAYVEGRQEEEREWERKRKQAELKSKKLLLANLTKEQKVSFKENGSFIVRGSKGGKYLITKGMSGNVYALTRVNRKKQRYCFYPHGDLPVYDVMLSQKLMLETKEKEAIQVANKLGL